ncbi:hypothetical protein [Halorubrum sp. SD626R]|uniref:DUF7311 family protein n=1 Tax=Halorubrum sp. SD626R TaxID=1419722 RepID=UPI000A8643F3|nr:hypothetical protein [Halorubrum sp. SD626R]TKX80862.1 hypothetical protein EXE53_07870 [Halorubrum sp. SD626R]
MIRVVLTVLVAVALLAAVAPALEDARAATTVERLDTEVDRIERAVGDLTADSMSVADPALAARTTLTVRVPSGFGAAPVDGVALVEIGGVGEADSATERATTDAADAEAAADGATETGTAATVDDSEASVALRYRIDGGRERTVPIVPGVADAFVALDGGAIALRPGGESRLVLRLVDDGGPTVRIARIG